MGECSTVLSKLGRNEVSETITGGNASVATSGLGTERDKVLGRVVNRRSVVETAPRINRESGVCRRARGTVPRRERAWVWSLGGGELAIECFSGATWDRVFPSRRRDRVVVPSRRAGRGRATGPDRLRYRPR